MKRKQFMKKALIVALSLVMAITMVPVIGVFFTPKAQAAMGDNITCVVEGDGIAVYSGNDDQALVSMALGARGLISVASNVIPRQMRELTAAWLAGDAARCRKLQLQYLPLIRLLFSEVNPIPAKAALSMMGRIDNALRLPLCPLDEGLSDALRAELRRIGITA